MGRPKNRTGTTCTVHSDQSTEDEEFESPPRQPNKVNATRSSERINKKRNRKFHMPSREDIFDSIPSTESPEKSFDSLRPRRIVNNFMKETNRYNFDPAYTDESSVDDFIDDELESLQDITDSDDPPDASSHPESEEEVKDTPQSSFHLVQTGQVLLSDSSESGDDDTKKIRMKHNSLIESDSDEENDESALGPCEASNDLDATKTGVEHDAKSTNGVQISNGQCTKDTDSGMASPTPQTKSDLDSELSDSELISPKRTTKLRKRKHTAMKRQILASDSSDSSSQDEPSKKRVVLASDDSEDSECDRLYSSNENASDDSADRPHRRESSARAEIMASRRQVRTSLLAEMHSKRKSKSDKA